MEEVRREKHVYFYIPLEAYFKCFNWNIITADIILVTPDMFPYPQRKYPQIHPLQKIKGVRQLEQAGGKKSEKYRWDKVIQHG